MGGLYGGKQACFEEISPPYKILVKLESVHMRSKPAHFAKISIDFAYISPRWDENFAYEHSQASHPG